MLRYSAMTGAGALPLALLAAAPLLAQTFPSQTVPRGQPGPALALHVEWSGQADSQPARVQPRAPQPESNKNTTPPTEQFPALNPTSQTAGRQPKRILWVIPNYPAVNANAQLPPLSPKGKLRLATQDSFDYSAFIVAGMVAGYSMATVQYPEFHQGAAGYQGATLHSELGGAGTGIDASVTFAGMTAADPQDRLLDR